MLFPAHTIKAFRRVPLVMGSPWEAKSMFCEGCGKPLNEKAQFCPNCGAETSIRKAGAQATQSLGTPEPHRKTGKRYVWLFLLLIPILFSALNAIPATVLTITIFGWLFVYQYAGVRRRTAHPRGAGGGPRRMVTIRMARTCETPLVEIAVFQTTVAIRDKPGFFRKSILSTRHIPSVSVSQRMFFTKTFNSLLYSSR
jgi:predicted RNA-binding Zn-ribbon protein involved in translation (DUF1610 family)